MCLRQAGAWLPLIPGRLFIFPFPGSIRLAGAGGPGYTGAPGWDATAALLRARQAAVTLAIFSPWKILWENVLCATCWPRDPPCVRGTCRPAICRSRRRWHWDKPGRDRGGAGQDAGMPFEKRKGRFPQREPAFQILVGPPGLEPGTCRL